MFTLVTCTVLYCARVLFCYVRRLIRNCTWYPFQPPDDFYMMVMDNCSIRQRYHEGNLAFWRERWPLVGDLQPIVPTFIPFPIYDYQVRSILR